MPGEMKIINLSLVSFPGERDPVAWIRKSLFFKGIWEAVAMQEHVIFMEFIGYKGKLKPERVTYHFKFRTRNALKFPLSVCRFVRNEAADIVVIHGLHFPWQVLLLKLFIGSHTKIIAQHHGEPPFRNFFKRWLQQLADKQLAAYFFTSRYQAQNWQHVIRDEQKIKEVMEISSVFYPISRQSARVVTKVKEQLTYIWVGHLESHKDPMTAIRAFSQFVSSGNNACLYMIFQSEALLPVIKAYLEQHPAASDAIQLVGRVAHEDLLYWYNSVDFVIATSHREAGGVSVCEAMSCGCIPLLSNIPSFTTMTGGACGFLFEKGSVLSLYDVLMRSRSVDVVAEKQRVLRQFQQQLSFDAIADNIRSILYNL